MTQQQFIEEIKQLSIAERVALIEVISRSLREDLETSGGEAAISDRATPEATIEDERERRVSAVQRLRGILKTEGPPPSDEEVKDMYTDYLIEKYS